MKRQNPKYLRLHTEDLGEPSPTIGVDQARFDRLGMAIEAATGWRLLVSDHPESGDCVWSSRIDGIGADQPIFLSLSGAGPVSTLDNAIRLSEAMSDLVHELMRTRRELWRREAELAAGVPVTIQNEELHLANRLEHILRGAAETIGCDAAGAYLLDEATTEIKLRASWGLPRSRLLEPARPLRGSVADLEALLGNAVVLEDTSLLPHWKTPEDFPSAVCVPISASSNMLGTLWVYSRKRREFNEAQTQMLEIVAGRIATELEKKMILEHASESKQDIRLEGAKLWQEKRLPLIAPQMEGWQVAGWTLQANEIGGDWFDWTVLPDGRMALCVGDSRGSPFEAALGAAACQAQIRSYQTFRHNPRRMMNWLNETTWLGSAQEQITSAIYAIVQPDQGVFEYSIAGTTCAAWIRENESRFLATKANPIGAELDTQFSLHRREMALGDTMLLMSEGLRNATHGGKRLLTSMIETARSSRDRSAIDLANALRETYASAPRESSGGDATLLVLRRCGE